MQLLKVENQKLKKQAVKFQETNNDKFSEIDDNFTKVWHSRGQYKGHVNNQVKDFEKNIFTILDELKIY